MERFETLAGENAIVDGVTGKQVSPPKVRLCFAYGQIPELDSRPRPQNVLAHRSSRNLSRNVSPEDMPSQLVSVLQRFVNLTILLLLHQPKVDERPLSPQSEGDRLTEPA